MRSPKLVSVVIPVYRSYLTDEERISFNRCVKILGDYPFAVVAPLGMALPPEMLERVIDGVITDMRFDARYFVGIEGYNKLMLSEEFYGRLSDYQYILIHQLDCYVFKDQLREWCAGAYDYVGAPWTGQTEVHIAWAARQCSLVRRALAKMGIFSGNKVGNGGFSLRRVKAAHQSLRWLRPGVADFNWNEDIFWSFYVSSYLPWFRIPSRETATQFGFEHEPGPEYGDLLQNPPFGCHKWNRLGEYGVGWP